MGFFDSVSGEDVCHEVPTKRLFKQEVPPRSEQLSP